jgi:hypothetical protein
MPQERRSIKRIKISYYVPVVNAESYEQLGILLEITPKGLLVDSQKVLPIDKPFRLRLDLTDESFDKPLISFTAKAKWVRPDRIEPSYYNIGFEMVEISDEDKKVVEKIMEKYAGWIRPQ